MGEMTFKLQKIMSELRRVIGHEPNDLGEMQDDNGYPLKDSVVAVIYVLHDGSISWYADEDNLP